MKIYGEIAILYTANDYGDMWQIGLNQQGQIDLRKERRRQIRRHKSGHLRSARRLSAQHRARGAFNVLQVRHECRHSPVDALGKQGSHRANALVLRLIRRETYPPQRAPGAELRNPTVGRAFCIVGLAERADHPLSGSLAPILAHAFRGVAAPTFHESVASENRRDGFFSTRVSCSQTFDALSISLL